MWPKTGHPSVQTPPRHLCPFPTSMPKPSHHNQARLSPYSATYSNIVNTGIFVGEIVSAWPTYCAKTPSCHCCILENMAVVPAWRISTEPCVCCCCRARIFSFDRPPSVEVTSKGQIKNNITACEGEMLEDSSAGWLISGCHQSTFFSHWSGNCHKWLKNIAENATLAVNYLSLPHHF